jgi:hypothetical protein
MAHVPAQRQDLREPAHRTERRPELHEVHDPRALAGASAAWLGVEAVLVTKGGDGPLTCSSTNKAGRWKWMTRLVIRHRIPKWRACQVTRWPGPIWPLVTPATARSPKPRMEPRCSSMLDDRSKTRSTGAAMSVQQVKRTTIGWPSAGRRPVPTRHRPALDSREQRHRFGLCAHRAHRRPDRIHAQCRPVKIRASTAARSQKCGEVAINRREWSHKQPAVIVGSGSPHFRAGLLIAQKVG